MIAAVVIACMAFAVASLAYIKAVETHDLLREFVEDMERELNDL